MTRRGVFLDLDSLNPADLDLAALRGCLGDWAFHAQTAPGEIGQRIKDASVVVTNKVVIDAGAGTGRARKAVRMRRAASQISSQRISRKSLRPSSIRMKPAREDPATNSS